MVDRDQVMKLSPNLSGHVVGGLVCYTDGLANPLLTSKAYAKTAENKGVKIHSRTRVVEARTTANGFRVKTAAGEVFESEVLVNATGAWAARFSNMLDDPLPVFAAAPTMMVDQPGTRFHERYLFGIDRTPARTDGGKKRYHYRGWWLSVSPGSGPGDDLD